MKKQLGEVVVYAPAVLVLLTARSVISTMHNKLSCMCQFFSIISTHTGLSHFKLMLEVHKKKVYQLNRRKTIFIFLYIKFFYYICSMSILYLDLLLLLLLIYYHWAEGDSWVKQKQPVFHFKQDTNNLWFAVSSSSKLWFNSVQPSPLRKSDSLHRRM